MILWQDTQDGIFFSEINSGKKVKTSKIADIDKNRNIQGPMTLVSPLKVASDKMGNAYALWAVNSRHHYRLFIKARIDGTWTEEAILKTGNGHVHRPDMKVDSDGNIHIAYTMLINPDELPVTSRKEGCYYMRIETKR